MTLVTRARAHARWAGCTDQNSDYTNRSHVNLEIKLATAKGKLHFPSQQGGFPVLRNARTLRARGRGRVTMVTRVHARVRLSVKAMAQNIH